MEYKICDYCGKEFESLTGRHRFCGAECRQAWEKNVASFEHTCTVCGKAFTNNKRYTKICSDECRKLANSNEHCKPRQCLYCGKTYQARKGEFCCKDHWRRYKIKHESIAPKPLDLIVREIPKGMSYGQYMAVQYSKEVVIRGKNKQKAGC